MCAYSVFNTFPVYPLSAKPLILLAFCRYRYHTSLFFEAGCFWQKQHHIYSYPLYYIDYVIAQLCAFEFKEWMDRDYEGAWKSYVKLCRMSASKFHTELLKDIGLDTPFADGTISKIVDGLEKLI